MAERTTLLDATAEGSTPGPPDLAGPALSHGHRGARALAIAAAYCTVATASRGRRISYSQPVSENSLKNQLFYGDNLDVLGRYVADESVDLVYLDPPFNSNANYNVLPAPLRC